MLLSLLAAAAPEQPSLLSSLALPLAFFAIFYFMIIRPNSKRNKEHKAMVDGLVGHEGVFAGGLVGKIKKIEGEYAIISLSNHTDVKIQRASVITVLPSVTIDNI